MRNQRTRLMTGVCCCGQPGRLWRGDFVCPTCEQRERSNCCGGPNNQTLTWAEWKVLKREREELRVKLKLNKPNQ